jgi:hypothetical protein
MHRLLLATFLTWGFLCTQSTARPLTFVHVTGIDCTYFPIARLRDKSMNSAMVVQ